MQHVYDDDVDDDDDDYDHDGDDHDDYDHDGDDDDDDYDHDDDDYVYDYDDGDADDDRDDDEDDDVVDDDVDAANDGGYDDDEEEEDSYDHLGAGQFVPQHTSTNAISCLLDTTSLISRRSLTDRGSLAGTSTASRPKLARWRKKVLRAQTLGEQVGNVAGPCSVFNLKFSRSHFGFHPCQTNLHMPAPLWNILANKQLQCRRAIRF